MMDLSRTLSSVGISAFGLGMPVLSPRWTDGAMPTVNDAGMSLSLASGTWVCPVAGTLRKIESSAIGVTLVHADGSAATGPGMLLTLMPQLYLRLARLYARLLEAGARPESDSGLPMRPVPRYFLYGGEVGASDVSGNINPGVEIGQAGDLTIYDNDGMPIDPLAVAAAFRVLMDEHNVLQHRQPVGSGFKADHQVKDIAELAASTSVVRVRLSNHAGQPYDGSNLEGLTPVATASGLFTLNSASGGDSDLTGAITKAATTGEDGSFPDEEGRLLVLGPATTGRLTVEFRPATLTTG